MTSLRSRCFLMLVLLPTLLGAGIPEFTEELETEPLNYCYIIDNPYKDFDWRLYGRQYKAALHIHTVNSDGRNTAEEMIEAHYSRGFDIIAITDHSFLTPAWDKAGYGLGTAISAETGTGILPSERRAEIEKGIGRFGRGMINIPYSNEQSVSQVVIGAEHINTFWADFNYAATSDESIKDAMTGIVRTAEELGGISFIAHPFREDEEPDYLFLSELFMSYPSCKGLEIINRTIPYSLSYEHLWDNILKLTMPEGRPVWGFSADDSHAVGHIGFSYNIMLLPELTPEAVRTATEKGSFYAVSVLSFEPKPIIPFRNQLESRDPRITEIKTGKNTITVRGLNYERAEWIADGERIAFGSTIYLDEHEDKINSYVRARLISQDGIAFTQPFGLGFCGGNCENCFIERQEEEEDVTEEIIIITATPPPVTEPLEQPLEEPLPPVGYSKEIIVLSVVVFIASSFAVATLLRKRGAGN